MKEKIDTSTDLLTDKEIAIVRDILGRELDVKPEQLDPGAMLEADLGADSLSKVEIIMALEDQFGLNVPDELAERVQTVGDVYETVAKMMGRSGPPR